MLFEFRKGNQAKLTPFPNPERTEMSATIGFYPLMVAAILICASFLFAGNRPAVAGWVVAAIVAVVWSISLHVTVADVLCVAGVMFVAALLFVGVGGRRYAHDGSDLEEE